MPAGGGTPIITCRTTGRSGLRLRDAWIDVRFTKAVNKSAIYFRAGQEKRPFSRYELTSPPTCRRSSAEPARDSSRSASNDLFGGAGFLSHDVGASLRLEHKLDDVRLITVKFGAYNGQGESLNDVNDKKSFGAPRHGRPITPKLDVGASWFTHDGIVTVGDMPDSSFTNYGVGRRRPVGEGRRRGAVRSGRVPRGRRRLGRQAEDAGHAGRRRLQHPDRTVPRPGSTRSSLSFRLDLADPDTDTDDDGATVITAGIGIYMSSKAWFRIAYERRELPGRRARRTSAACAACWR